jgi:hypothetical protein
LGGKPNRNPAVANKKKPSDDDRMHGRSREVKHVVNQMSDVDFFDYRLVVRSSGIQELMAGHSNLRQGLIYVESLVEEMRSGNYGVAYSQLLRSLEVFENSYNQIRRALVELGEYYDDHPTEVREINHGLTDLCDGCDNLVKAMVSLRQTKTGESLELSRRALTHLREAAHRIGSHLRDIKDCCPSNIEYEVMDIRENEIRAESGLEGARPVEMPSCHATHGPGEPCDQKAPVDRSQTDGKKGDKRIDEELEHEQVVAHLVEKLEDKHVPLNQIAETVTTTDPAQIEAVPMLARDFQDESAMEDLMRHVSENRARTIDRLVSDARAAKAEAIANTDHVPMPGEQVPGMQPMGVKTGPMQAAANVVDVQSKIGKSKNDTNDSLKGKSEKSEKAEKSEKSEKLEKKSEKVEKAEKVEKVEKVDKFEKQSKSGKHTKIVLENALEKAKEKAKRPPGKIGSKSETSLPATVASEKKTKKDEDLNELTFDDSDLDFNKAGKKIP